MLIERLLSRGTSLETVDRDRCSGALYRPHVPHSAGKWGRFVLSEVARLVSARGAIETKRYVTYFISDTGRARPAFNGAEMPLRFPARTRLSIVDKSPVTLVQISRTKRKIDFHAPRETETKFRAFGARRARARTGSGHFKCSGEKLSPADNPRRVFAVEFDSLDAGSSERIGRFPRSTI